MALKSEFTKPNFSVFEKLAKKGNLIPIVEEISADLDTPVSIFLKIAHELPHAFLLESVELGENLGRFSLIGINPLVTLEYSIQKGTKIYDTSTKKIELSKLPFPDLMQHMLKQYQYVTEPLLPPLVGAFVGYIGYELVQEFETIKLHSKKMLPLPDAILFLPKTLVIFDHIKHSLKVVCLAVVKNQVREAYHSAICSIEQVTKQIKKPAHSQIFKSSKLKSRPRKQSTSRFHSNMSQNKFESNVKIAKRHIQAGDCIQIVLSQRFSLGKIKNPFAVYRALRSLNPSPYMFYFRHGNLKLVGSSPELLVRKQKSKVEVRPIAGTRPRGINAEEDAANESELCASKKELAEHLMLVDLGRNDLGRVAQTNSVHVPKFARIEKYSHVMHLVSDVEATLKKSCTMMDLLRATFPAGTVTGAPKIKAMEMIDQLERESRGPYAGCLGYLGLTGDMDMCITIRTIVIHHNQAYVQAGAGIVNDSNPSAEYQETLNKARALFQAVERARGTSHDSDD